MTSGLRQFPVRFWFGAATLAPICFALLLVLFAPPDGVERSELLQFVGRFHPLAVHLPIALLLLVPLFELLGRTKKYPQLLATVDFILGLSVLGAIGALLLGWCLGRSGGYSGSLVTQHMWGGLLIALAAWSCWMLRSRSSGVKFDPVYGAALFFTVAVVSFTGYRGGQLSQGENHLTEHMPSPLRSLFGVAAPGNSAVGSGASVAANTVFAAIIQPLFNDHCVSCHGPSKHKANLRLDSYEAVMRGSKDGPVIHPGEPSKSELFRRITLPATDDDFMPADNKPPISPAGVQSIEKWITAGASVTQLADTANATSLGSPTSPKLPDVEFPHADPEAVAKSRSALSATVAQLQKQFPNVLDYESRGSANLILNTSLLGAKFGDNELAAFAAVGDRIVTADLSGTAISDHSSKTIAAMKHLRGLRLMRTKISDATIEEISGLPELETLSLYETPVTSASLNAFSRMPKLRRVYVQETKIKPEALTSAELKSRLVF